MKNFLPNIGSPWSRVTKGDYHLVDAPSSDIVSSFSLDSFINPIPFFQKLLKKREIGQALKELEHEELKEAGQFFDALFESIKKNDLEKQTHIYKTLGICYPQALMAEIIAKVLSSRETLEGQSINLPALMGDEWKQVSYRLNFIRIGKKLPVLIMRSTEENAPVWISPRGTSPYFGIRTGSLESLLFDFNKKEGVDLSALNNRKEELRSIMKKGRTILTGHSLGGLLALKIAIDHADLSPLTYTFCSPGIDKTNKLYFDTLKKKPAVFQFLTEGDPIPSSGRHLLGDMFAVHVKNYKNNLIMKPFGNHVRLTLNTHHSIKKVDVIREEKTLSRAFMETIIRGGLFRNLCRPLKKLYFMLK